MTAEEHSPGVHHVFATPLPRLPHRHPDNIILDTWLPLGGHRLNIGLQGRRADRSRYGDLTGFTITPQVMPQLRFWEPRHMPFSVLWQMPDPPLD